MSSPGFAKKSKIKQTVLDALVKASGSFVSGTRVSAELGMSRAAVWKQIEILRKEGYSVSSKPRIGYCLTGVPDRFYPFEVKRLLKAEIMGSEIDYFDSLGSTNDETMKRAVEGAPEGTVVIAEEQTKGKGRLGRAWISPKYQGIWFSIVLRPEVLPAETGLITLAVAVAVARAVKQETGLDVEIKWPNDLLIKGKKVAGILTEMSSEQDKVHFMVVGVGINANVDPGSFPGELRATATSLREQLGRDVNRVRLLCSVLNELESSYRSFREKRSDEIVRDWKELSSTLGKKVEVKILDRIFVGVAGDIDEGGQLIIRMPDGELISVSAGEITYLR